MQTNKRYMLFWGVDYYPAGGMNDFDGYFDSVEDAYERVTYEILTNEHAVSDSFWGHVYDIETGDKIEFEEINDLIHLPPRNVQEFNKKWEYYIEEGYDGLEFDDPDVIAYLDSYFRDVKFGTEKVNGKYFSLQQIKLKFGKTRFYADGITDEEAAEIEQEINRILESKTENNDN